MEQRSFVAGTADVAFEARLLPACLQVLDPPRSWLRFFRCMRERYPGYPRGCPISRRRTPV
eukprot:2813903-Pleurochrysis_carterae.AAC.3